MLGFNHFTNSIVINECTDNTAEKWSDNRYPGIGCEAGPATDDGNPETWTEVTSRIDCITCIQAKRCTDGEDQETDDKRIEVPLYRLIASVSNREDQTYQQGCAYKLIAKCPKGANKSLW